MCAFVVIVLLPVRVFDFSDMLRLALLIQYVYVSLYGCVRAMQFRF